MKPERLFLNRDEYSAVCDDFLSDCAIGRSLGVYKRNCGHSVEIKISVIDPLYLNKILTQLLGLEILRTTRRREIHHLFATDNLDNKSLVYVPGITTPWIKIKENLIRHQTPKNKFPAISRKVAKYKPEHTDYGLAEKHLKHARFISIFEKDCCNFYFESEKNVFSLSVSIAANRDGFFDVQAELEFEGNYCGQQTSISNQLALLENVIAKHFSAFTLDLSSETKLEKILKIKKKP